MTNEQSPWIRVTDDNLPPLDKVVVAWVKDRWGDGGYEVAQRSMFYDKGECWEIYGTFAPLEPYQTVTHWTWLPEPPEVTE